MGVFRARAATRKVPMRVRVRFMTLFKNENLNTSFYYEFAKLI